MASFDQLALASMDPRVPRDERFDISNEVLKVQVGEWLSKTRYDAAEVMDAIPSLAKASQLQPFYQPVVAGRPKPGHTSILYLNEYGVIDQGRSRYLEKTTTGGFEFLRDVVYNTDVIQAIIRTIVLELMPFLVPVSEESPFGYTFERIDKKKLAPADEKPIQDLIDFLTDSGDEHDSRMRTKLRRLDLEGFVTRLLWDTFTADACPIELVNTFGGRLTGYHNLDFATIRLCSESGYEGDDEVQAVQLYENIPAVTFGYEDLLYPVRTPRTDIRSGGYGYAEPEGIVRAIIGYINANAYNAAGLDRSALPRGVMALFGESDQPQLETFKQGVRMMVSGATNRHNVPVVSFRTKEGGVQWVPMDTFDEMAFARWITLKVSVCCAFYGVDPNNIHFDSFSTRSAGLGGKPDTAEKLSQSHDKGFIPRARFVAKTLQELLKLRQGPKPTYRIRFVGIHQDDEDRKHELVKATSTANEIREARGEKKWTDPLMGNAPAANPTLMPLYTQRALMAQQAAMMGGGGGPGGPGGGGPGGPGGEEGDDEGGPPGPPQARGPAGPPSAPRAERPVAKALTDFMAVIERERPYA